MLATKLINKRATQTFVALLILFTTTCFTSCFYVTSQRGYDAIIETSPFAIIRYKLDNEKKEQKVDNNGDVVYAHETCDIIFDEIPCKEYIDCAVEEYNWVREKDCSISYTIIRDTWNEKLTLLKDSKVAKYEYNLKE